MQEAPPIPAFHELRAPVAWRQIDFISDLHLWPQGPRTFEAWASYMGGSTADAVFILGDLFEVWVGDDVRAEPFEAACADVLRSAAASRHVGFMHGNRDFMVGAGLLSDVQVAFMPDPTVLVAFGRRVLLTHGDELCLGDTEYQRFRAMTRTPQWKQQFLARPLAERKAFVRKLRADSQQRKATTANGDAWVDVDIPAAVRWMEAADTPVLVHGHTHMPADEDIGPDRKRIVLSDWDLDLDGQLAAGIAYAAQSRPRCEVLRLTARGFSRLAPDEAC